MFFFLLFLLSCSPQCFHVPYSALTMFLSTDQRERDSATAYRTSPPYTPIIYTTYTATAYRTSPPYAPLIYTTYTAAVAMQIYGVTGLRQ